MAPRRAAAGDRCSGLGHAGIRSGATVPAARRRARRPLRATSLGDQRGAAGAAAVRSPRLCPGRAGDRGARPSPAVPARVRHQPRRRRQLSGQCRLDAGTVGRGLRAGRPPRGGARHPRPLRADRAAAGITMGAGAAARVDRRRTGVGRRTRRGGAQSRHPLRDRVRPGLPRQRARLSAGGKRRSGGARRQAVDAVDGHPETSRRGAAPGGRRLRRPAGPARRLSARRRRARRGAASRCGDRGQHLGQRHSGKPWAASLSARVGRAAAGGDATAGDGSGVLGRHQHRTLALADQPVVAADQARHRWGGDHRARAVVRAARVAGRAHRGHAVAVGGSGAAAVLVGANRLLPRRAVVGQRRNAAVHRLPAQRLRTDDRWTRVPVGPGQRRIRVEYHCGQRYLGANADKGDRRADPDGASRWNCPRSRPAQPERSVRRVCCPTCSGWGATPNAPRTWPGCSP